MEENVIVNGDVRLDKDNRRVQICGREINLTGKEFELLEFLVANPGKVYGRARLLQLIWGKDYPGDERTVDVHVRRLREKIEPNPSEPRYVQTKWGGRNRWERKSARFSGRNFIAVTIAFRFFEAFGFGFF